MYPITGSQGEELSASLSTSPPQEAAESNEAAAQPPLNVKFCHFFTA